MAHSWLAWVVGSIGDRVYGRMSERTIAAERTATIVLIVTLAVELLSGVLAVMVVRRLTARQEVRAERLRTPRA